ncbi:MAG: hypothetical protein WCR52_03165 [Bacteroidota bacterium]
MALENTFIYDPAAPDAGAQFTKILQDELILMVVMGKDAKATAVVTEADDQASLTMFGVKRKVIWLPDHKAEKAKCLQILQSLTSFDPTQFDTIVAFSVKPVSDKAADILFPDEVEDEISTLLRIKRAFARAGQDFRTNI